MDKPEKPPNKFDEFRTYLCRERTTGASHQGELSIEPTGMRLRLVSFDGVIAIKNQRRWVLDLEDARVATLRECVGGGGGNRWRRGGQMVGTHRALSNEVLIGSGEWADTDRVHSMRFTFHGAELALQHSAHIRSKRSKAGKRHVETLTLDYSRLEVFKAKAAGASVQIWLRVTESVDAFERGYSSHPFINIDFDEGQTTADAREFALNVITFFSLCIGTSAHPLGMTVCSMSEKAWEENRKVDGPDPHYELRNVWNEIDHVGSRIWVGSAPFWVVRQVDVANCKRGLEFWLKRRAEWGDSYRQAGAALIGRNSLSRERMLALFAWFESLPIDVGTGLPPKRVDRLVKAAVKKSDTKAIGLGEHKDRIRGVLGALKDVSPGERFRRLIPLLRQRFGDKLVPESLEKDCLEARKIRGTAFHPKGRRASQDHLKVMRAFAAVELTCFLATLLDLPLTEDGIGRLHQDHPLLQYLLLRREAREIAKINGMDAD